MTKKSNKNLNILRTKRAFKVKQKTFFIIFKRLLVAKNCLRPESAPPKWCTFDVCCGMNLQSSYWEAEFRKGAALTSVGVNSPLKWWVDYMTTCNPAPAEEPS